MKDNRNRAAGIPQSEESPQIPDDPGRRKSALSACHHDFAHRLHIVGGQAFEGVSLQVTMAGPPRCPSSTVAAEEPQGRGADQRAELEQRRLAADE